MDDDDFIEDANLLIEAARYAVSMNCPRNRFMSQAKKAWYRAAFEAGRDPQTLRTEKHARQAE